MATDPGTLIGQVVSGIVFLTLSGFVILRVVQAIAAFVSALEGRESIVRRISNETTDKEEPEARRAVRNTHVNPARFMWARNNLLGLYSLMHGAPYGSGLAWPAEELQRVGAGFEQMSAALELPNVVLLLTDESADVAAINVYVFFEPSADVVLALSHTEKEMAMVPELFDSNGMRCQRLIDGVEDLLRNGEIGEALLLCVRTLPETVRRS